MNLPIALCCIGLQACPWPMPWHSGLCSGWQRCRRTSRGGSGHQHNVAWRHLGPQLVEDCSTKIKHDKTNQRIKESILIKCIWPAMNHYDHQDVQVHCPPLRQYSIAQDSHTGGHLHRKGLAQYRRQCGWIDVSRICSPKRPNDQCLSLFYGDDVWWILMFDVKSSSGICWDYAVSEFVIKREIDERERGR